MQTVFLGDIANKITKGTTPSTYGAKFTESGVNFVKVESITAQGGFLVDKFVHIDESTHHNMLKRSIIEEGDILLTMAGAIGRVAQVPKDILPANTNQAVSIIRINHKDADSRYIRYFLESPNAKSQFFAGITQSAQPNLSLGNISKIQVPLPELDTQKKIVDILGSIDEKIELNRKMNDTLEQMGQALFRHYFITGNESEKVSLRDLVTETSNKIGSDDQSKYTVLSAVKSGELIASEVYFTKQVFSKDISKYKIVIANDFAYNPARVNIGSIGMLDKEIFGAVSPVYVTFRVKDGYNYAINELLKLPVTRRRIVDLCSGTVRQILRFEDFCRIKAHSVPTETLNEFNSQYEVLRAHISQNSIEMHTLTSIRDTLLPRLISGKLKL